MGTPDFAVASLASIVKANYEVVGVVTAPDKPAGRGRKLKSSAVKEFAVLQGLKVLQPTNLKSETFIEEIRLLDPNLFVVVAFRMLPKVVWEFPEFGTFNLHASLLPDYRGAAPINWVIINGEQKTGVTTFFINEKIDCGEIILNKEVAIGTHENLGQLHDKLMEVGSLLVIETLQLIEQGSLKTKKQPEVSINKAAPKIFTETCRINWQRSITELYNFIRGLNPFPGAWTMLESNEGKPMKVKLFDVEIFLEKHTQPIGSICLEDKIMRIYAEEGYFQVNSLQIEGKKKMQTQELLNGFKFQEGSRFL